MLHELTINYSTKMDHLRTFNLFLLCICTMLVIFTAPLKAQTGTGEYSLGNELLREGKFEEAFEIFERMMIENPRSFAVYDRAITALVNLKRYDEAIRITKERLDRSGTDINTRVKLGEIFDISGERDQALQTWREVIKQHPENAHAYRRVAETMNQRRLYREAIDIYKMARNELADPSLFTFEIANNYLAVADFEPAMEEYLDIIDYDHRRTSLIQRQLLNYDEQRLYDTAILLTEERLGTRRPGSDTDVAYRDFLIWLNMERGLYRRALAAARTLERYTNNEHHAVFRLGRDLRSRNEFELAEQAFSYYLELEAHPLTPRSYEELSRCYQDWAGYMVDRNLDFDGAADSLYYKAFRAIEQLTNRYPRYDRLMQTLVIQSELALDHLKDPDRAEIYKKKMEQIARDESEQALIHYIDGRILLFRGDFTMARVSFNRSNRIAGSNAIADKSRYYLGLGDFYNSDFTYARLQLRSLERQNHSWYANNALQLRYMIQQGQDEENDNAEIKRYAQARYFYDTGHYTKAADLLTPVLDEPVASPLHNESILLLTRTLRRVHPELAFHVVDRHTSRPTVQQAAGERLLWERARLAEVVFIMQQRDTEKNRSADGLVPAGLLAYPLSAEERFYGGVEGPGRMLLSAEGITGFYEELLLRYPDGYYSDIARNRIRELERLEREI